jgi:hypothetical protein
MFVTAMTVQAEPTAVVRITCMLLPGRASLQRLMDLRLHLDMHSQSSQSYLSIAAPTLPTPAVDQSSRPLQIAPIGVLRNMHARYNARFGSLHVEWVHNPSTSHPVCTCSLAQRPSNRHAFHEQDTVARHTKKRGTLLQDLGPEDPKCCSMLQCMQTHADSDWHKCSCLINPSSRQHIVNQTDARDPRMRVTLSSFLQVCSGTDPPSWPFSAGSQHTKFTDPPQNMLALVAGANKGPHSLSAGVQQTTNTDSPNQCCNQRPDTCHWHFLTAVSQQSGPSLTDPPNTCCIVKADMKRADAGQHYASAGSQQTSKPGPHKNMLHGKSRQWPTLRPLTASNVLDIPIQNMLHDIANTGQQSPSVGSQQTPKPDPNKNMLHSKSRPLAHILRFQQQQTSNPTHTRTCCKARAGHWPTFSLCWQPADFKARPRLKHVA